MPLRLFAGTLVLLSACKPDIPTISNGLPDIMGEWTYSASDIRVVGRPPTGSCQIQGVTLLLGPWRPTGLFGRSEGGSLTCSGDLQPLSEQLPSYAVRNAGAVLNFIAFDIGSPNWRHDGTIAGDTMSGRFWLQHPGLRLEGSFLAVLKKGSSSVPAADRQPIIR